jgi:PhzF family phenazine biosynthesis protein
MARAFRQVDVFSEIPFRGNPVAVVLDGDGLDADDMRAVARWTNLSETTFVMPPADQRADYRVRIFTPSAELPFAGHPTLGTCHAWLEAGGVPLDESVVIQECGAGLVRVRRDRTPPGRDRLAFAAPPLLRSGPVDESLLRRIAEGLRIELSLVVDAAWVDNGPGWVGVLLPDADAVLALQPGPLGDLYVGVAGPHPSGSPAALEVRAFFPVDGGTAEDPVTGSLNASLAEWLLDSGRVDAPYIAAQGTRRHREGLVHVDRDADGTVWIAGTSRTLISGTIDA